MEHKGDSDKTNQRSEHRSDSDKTNQRSYWNTGVILIKQKHKHTLTSNIKKSSDTTYSPTENS